MLPKSAYIREIVQENYRTQSYILERTIEARPGQFCMVWLPRVDEKPLSIVEADPLTFTVADVGPFSHALTRLRAGDSLHYRGPYGTAFELQGKRILLVGGGYGVGPLYFLAKQALKRAIEPRVVIGARTEDDLLFDGRFRFIGIEPVLTTEDGSRGIEGLATDAATGILKNEPIDAVYSCGPEKMMRRLGEIAEGHRVPCFLSAERYMKCGGLSLCGACELNGVLLCSEGPVLPYSFLKALPDFGFLHREATARKVPW